MSIDPSVIDLAPDSVPVSAADAQKQISQLTEINARLSEELSEAQAELAKEDGKTIAEKTKAQLIKPYAENLFKFMCFYTTGVGILLFLSGAGIAGFHLDDNVLMVIAGSTALAIIGLVKIVVSGLFEVVK